jgi:hypothetical protein
MGLKDIASRRIVRLALKQPVLGFRVGADDECRGFTLKFKLRARSRTYFLRTQDSQHMVRGLNTAAARFEWSRTAENDAPPLEHDDWRVESRVIGDNRIEVSQDFVAWAVSDQSREIEYLGFPPGLMMLLIDTISDATLSFGRKGSEAVH